MLYLKELSFFAGLNMRGSLLSLSTNGGADTNSSVTSSSGGPSPHHLATMPRRQGSSSSSSSSSHRRRNVHRSQSTHRYVVYNTFLKIIKVHSYYYLYKYGIIMIRFLMTY